jgi:hypothetical protein
MARFYDQLILSDFFRKLPLGAVNGRFITRTTAP